MQNKKYYVYVILTVNNKLYCGYTDDVERRYKLHKQGKGAKFTRANKPFMLVYSAEFNTKIEAQTEERRIKKLSRKQKEEFIKLPVYDLDKC